MKAAVKPVLLDNVQDLDLTAASAEDVDEETLEASIQKARLSSTAIALVACGAKRTARAIQPLPNPDPHLSFSATNNGSEQRTIIENATAFKYVLCYTAPVYGLAM